MPSGSSPPAPASAAPLVNVREVTINYGSFVVQRDLSFGGHRVMMGG